MNGFAIDETVLLARQTCYQFFAKATSDPASGRWRLLHDPGYQRTAIAAADCLRAEAEPSSVDAVAPGERPVTDLRLDIAFRHLGKTGKAEETHGRIFGFLLTKDCPPYETEYCPQTLSVYRSHKMADVAGFYSAFGLEPGRDFPERPDHVSLELEFMAWLIGKMRLAAEKGGPQAEERRGVCADGQEHFLADHLSWWVPAFCTALRKKAEGSERAPASTFQGALADALAAFVSFERGWLNIPEPTELVAANPSEDEPEMTCAACDFAGVGIETSGGGP
jgi:TorA maturation chaperone TorD